MTEQELLAVLDMSKKEQRQWLLVNYFHQRMPGVSTADLAFRLRDEACKVSCENYYKALEAVYNHRIKDKQCCSFYAFQTYRIRPIDMIIAALMAKEKEK